MKIELTIALNYLPDWHAYEGIRELLQNAKDAETEFSAPMSVRMRGDTLVIENEGCTMPYEALLLGHTTKASRGDLIGKFGEGFKLGILALIRAGHAVKIRNGSEVWTPEIVHSEKFDSDVLAFDIVGGRKDENRVQIEVEGIGADTFRDEIRPRFLWLDRDARRKDDVVETPGGSLLLSERYRGRLFVKGIFVEHRPSLSVGYDFRDADVDRDRRMIQSWDFSYKSREIWRNATAQRPDLFPSFLEMFEQNAAEVQDFGEYDAGRISPEFAEHAVKAFRARHGDKAVPVGNLAESADIEHFGRQGIVVPKGLRAVLERTLGPLSKVQEDLKHEAIRVYSWDELSDVQRQNLKRAITMISKAGEVLLDEISIVDFRSADLFGTHAADGIKIASKVLADRRESLATLVHEVAHRAGGDGDKGHVAEIERIWSTIVENLT